MSFLVSDYMRTTVPTARPSDTFREALATMVRQQTNGLIIIDEDRKIKGVLSSWDMIQFIVPDYLEEDKHLAAFEANDVFAKRIEELKDRPVADFMSTSVHACHADHALMEAATMLSEFRIRQLPVIDKSGVLVGYINRTDIKKAMADVLSLNN